MIENAGKTRPISQHELNQRLRYRHAQSVSSSTLPWHGLLARLSVFRLQQCQATQLIWPLVCLGSHLFSGITGITCLALLAQALPKIFSVPGFQNQLMAVLATALLSVFCGTRLRALGNIQHECSHRSFVNQDQVNEAIGLIIGVLLLQPFRRYRQAHFTHHRFLGKGVRDRDLSRYNTDFVHTASAATLTGQLTMAAEPQHFRVGLRVSVFDDLDPVWCNLMRAGILCLLATAAVAALVSGSSLTLFVSALPFVLVYPFLCVWSDIADHAIGYRKSKEPPEHTSVVYLLTRNHLFRSNVLNALFFPRNDAYHLIHHLYPSLPVSDYPAAHQILLESDSAYSQLDHTLLIR